MNLGKQITQIRTQKGIKQVDIAERLGIDVSNYSRLEKKENKITVEQLTQIAEALGVTVLDLLGISGGVAPAVSNDSAKVEKLQNENKKLLQNVDNLILNNKIFELELLRINDKLKRYKDSMESFYASRLFTVANECNIPFNSGIFINSMTNRLTAFTQNGNKDLITLFAVYFFKHGIIPDISIQLLENRIIEMIHNIIFSRFLVTYTSFPLSVSYKDVYNVIKDDALPLIIEYVEEELNPPPF